MTVGANIIQTLLLYTVYYSVYSTSIVELTVDNFDSSIKENKCMLIYANKTDCEKCKLLYHKFLIAAQTFENDKNILFGRISDEMLLQAFEVTSFPGILYYEYGSAVPKLYLGDITSAALTKLMSDAVKTDFRKLDRQHSIKLTSSTFEEIMNTERQARLVMLHEADDIDEIELYEEIAETYDNENDIIIARINVDEERKLRKQYNAIVYPSFYWYPKGTHSKKKRYGGELNIPQMISFINKQCNFYRTKGGRLNPYAGLIKPLDDVINIYGKDLYEITNIARIRTEIKREMTQLSSDIDYELAEFYLALVNEIEEDRTIEILDENRSRIYRQMDGAGPLELDQLIRKKNIVQKFIDIIGNHLLEELTEGNTGELIDLDKYYGFEDHGLEFHEEL
ncbi:hypothetical protein ACF0H5_015883 [Mactra antiquata]